jgi:hypothetical protein
MRNETEQLDKTLLSAGGAALDISDDETGALFSRALAEALETVRAASAPVSSALLIPPDITRIHSRAGFLTRAACRELTKAGIAVTVLPALGTHSPLTAAGRARMFPGMPEALFRVHNWRDGAAELGRIEREWVEKATEGAVSYDWPVQVNRMLRDGGFGLIISLGQVLPHEVTGMANHAKNILVGTGGKEAVDKSHFAGAACGMEKIMGRTDTPVRAMFDEGLRRYGSKLPPVLYALTVLSPRSGTEAAQGKPAGSQALRGVFCGFGRGCFEEAASLSRQVNISLLDEAIQKAVAWLDPQEYRTLWLGNKAVYRLRMALSTGGELLIIAPGLERFGEDAGVDALIRKHGYRAAGLIREKVKTDAELADSLGAAAHLIHGSSEGRFTVRYCPGPGLSRREIEAAGYEWGDIGAAMANYGAGKLATGWNTAADGGRFFFVPNPALGLWALKGAFN